MINWTVKLNSNKKQDDPPFEGLTCKYAKLLHLQYFSDKNELRFFFQCSGGDKNEQFIGIIDIDIYCQISAINYHDNDNDKLSR